MAKVSGHAKAPKGRLHKITVEHAANGFSVKAHRQTPEPFGPMPEDEPPSVFTRHAPAVKHLKNLMQEMHPEPAAEPTTGDMTGEEPEGQQS